jgi:hypothetical protein
MLRRIAWSLKLPMTKAMPAIIDHYCKTIDIISLFLPFMPFLMAAVVFGIFHLVAYKIVWGIVIWAMIIMVLWIISYFVTGKDDTAMNTAHYGWNGIQTMKETVTLAIAKSV